MPLYEYKCDRCTHIFEQRQLINDDPLKKCPECGRLKLRRIIHPGLYAYVAKAANDYKKLGDLAQHNTEKMSSDQFAEKVAKTCKAPKLDPEQKKLNKILPKLSKKEQQEYINRGVLPVPSDEHSLGMSSLTGKTKKKRIRKKKK